MSNGINLNLVAVRPALRSECTNTVDLLVRVEAPDAPKTGLPERPRLNLSLVIDRSGSMSGRPLHEAKRAAGFIVDSLKATDRLSVVAYDDTVRVVAANRPVTDKAHLKALLAQIESRGSTNLHGGWLAGAEETAKHLGPGYTSRVLVLSDGQANQGLTDIDEIASQCGALAAREVSTSTYGLGDGFNEQLMLAMARAGRGRGYYCETAEILLDRFQEEFALLSSLCARGVRLYLTPTPGVRLEMLNDYEKAHDGSWQLPDLAFDGEAWAAVRLHLNTERIPPVGEALKLITASVEYRDLDDSKRYLPETSLTLPVKTAAEYFEVREDDATLRRIVEAEAARLQEKASHAARHGDWTQVRDSLKQCRAMAVHSPWLNDIVANLENIAAAEDQILFSKEAGYAAANMACSLRTKYESREIEDDAAAPAFLRRKRWQGRSEPRPDQV